MTDRKQNLIDFATEHNIDIIEDSYEGEDCTLDRCDICNAGPMIMLYPCKGHNGLRRQWDKVEFKACNACLVGWHNDDFTGDDL